MSSFSLKERAFRLRDIACCHSAKKALSQQSKNAGSSTATTTTLSDGTHRRKKLPRAVPLPLRRFPENLLYLEFRRRYSLLASPDARPVNGEPGDERAATEALLQQLDLEPSSYRLGLSQIFLRAGTLSLLESQREEKLAEGLIHLQAHLRGYLARKRFQQRKVQELAICCIQRNVRKFLEIRDWPWWRLFIKIAPVLNVQRTEQELRLSREEVEQLKAKVEKLEKERSELKQSHDLLEVKGHFFAVVGGARVGGHLSSGAPVLSAVSFHDRRARSAGHAWPPSDAPSPPPVADTQNRHLSIHSSPGRGNNYTAGGRDGGWRCGTTGSAASGSLTGYLTT
ncbi:hypothetical protein HPB52_023249 [Rhipicephalus sanguineus]|uniref:Myosin motor domain-containing protein n=1 Tax=Rhipicephalus sanguineus TaxID=34632 RepID=A0A9D4PXZ8_RHISA|nr:hypothetical protein HPB52_023249 [Rhipicephalus sanguineus]